MFLLVRVDSEDLVAAAVWPFCFVLLVCIGLTIPFVAVLAAVISITVAAVVYGYVFVFVFVATLFTQTCQQQ